MRNFKPILLIAVNFVREQRWPILVLQLWVLGLAALGLVLDMRHDREDLLLMFKQLALYGVAFSVFFGGSAIYNERRSRRILAVLAKSITRRDYLSGLLLGVALASGLFCLVLGWTGSWSLGSIGFSVPYLWYLMLCLQAACILAAAVALFYSTHLNPWMSALMTGLSLGVPGVLAYQFGGAWGYFLPVYTLMRIFLKASFHGAETVWMPILIALAESVLLWLAAGWVFGRVDVAVAVD
jgi:hypothetical protein